VCVPVVAEVVLTAESFAADVALERSLVGMRSLVNQQVVRLGEVSSAEAADELAPGSAHQHRRRYTATSHSRPITYTYTYTFTPIQSSRLHV